MSSSLDDWKSNFRNRKHFTSQALLQKKLPPSLLSFKDDSVSCLQMTKPSDQLSREPPPLPSKVHSILSFPFSFHYLKRQFWHLKDSIFHVFPNSRRRQTVSTPVSHLAVFSFPNIKSRTSKQPTSILFLLCSFHCISASQVIPPNELSHLKHPNCILTESTDHTSSIA
jgi:hypothetical protein